MYYTLHQLQIFLKTSELQSITKASEELHLTQPAVSIQLKNFKISSRFHLPRWWEDNFLLRILVKK